MRKYRAELNSKNSIISFCLSLAKEIVHPLLAQDYESGFSLVFLYAFSFHLIFPEIVVFFVHNIIYELAVIPTLYFAYIVMKTFPLYFHFFEKSVTCFHPIIS